MTVTKEKITVSIDRGVLAQARELMGTTNTSSVLEEALRQLIRAERDRRDAAAYDAAPDDGELRAWGALKHDWSDFDGDVDWAAECTELVE